MNLACPPSPTRIYSLFPYYFSQYNYTRRKCINLGAFPLADGRRPAACHLQWNAAQATWYPPMKRAPGTGGTVSAGRINRTKFTQLFPEHPFSAAPAKLNHICKRSSPPLRRSELLSESSAAPCWEAGLHSRQTPLLLPGTACRLIPSIFKSYSNPELCKVASLLPV